MLFFVKQTHTPDHCPVRHGGGPESLFEPNVDGLSVRFGVADTTRHVIYYLVEADSVEPIRKLVAPGVTDCTVEINPVSELPAFARS